MIPMPPIIATWPSLIREGGGLQPAGPGFTVTSHLGGRSPRGYEARCSRAGGYRRPWEARRIGTGGQEGVGDEANVGDWLVIKGTTTERSDQRGLITEVHSADGSPPYVVRWLAPGPWATGGPGPDP